MSDSEPNWNLLPHDPTNFFGLSETDGFRELKRAYNRLLRQFKPEKFPAEFQRIRESYENLSERLRYGTTQFRPQSKSSSQFKDIHSDHSQPQATISGPAAKTSPGAKQVRDRLRDEPISTLYHELRTGPVYTPQDYLMLAFMADLQANQTSGKKAIETFPVWILRGLKAFPNDAQLIAMFREYLIEYYDRPSTRVLMLRLADVAKDSFFYITERVWGLLIERLPFAEFRKFLAECEERLGQHSDMNRLIFYVYLLRRSLWKADTEWLENISNHLEDNYFDLPTWAQNEVEFVDSLRQYRQRRAEFASICPLAADIDQAIEAYCSSPESEADWRILQCQTCVAQRGFLLAVDFPDQLADNSLQVLFFSVWDRILAEVLDRVGEHREIQPTADELQRKTETTMIRVNKRWAKSSTSRSGNFICLIGLCLAILGIVAAICFLIRGVQSFMNIGFWQGMFDICLAVGSVVTGSCVGVLVTYSGVRTARMNYSYARRDLISLLRAAPISETTLLELVQNAEGKKFDDDSVSDTRVVVKGIQADYAVRLFCRAMMTLAR